MPKSKKKISNNNKSVKRTRSGRKSSSPYSVTCTDAVDISVEEEEMDFLNRDMNNEFVKDNAVAAPVAQNSETVQVQTTVPPIITPVQQTSVQRTVVAEPDTGSVQEEERRAAERQSTSGTKFTVTVPAEMPGTSVASTGNMSNSVVNVENNLWGNHPTCSQTLSNTTAFSTNNPANYTNNNIDVPNVCMSAEDDITSHVPVQLREKIWKNEYINMALLLKGSTDLAEYCYGGSIYTDPITGQLQTKPIATKEKIKNIEQFTDAFMIFMSIYLKRFPTDAIAMLQYVKTLRMAAYTTPGNGWINYDEQFRLRKAISPNMPWGELKSALWLTTVGNASYGNQNQNSSIVNHHTQQSQHHRINLPCFDFNSGRCTWRNCKYLHVCALCKSSAHVEANCTNSQQSTSLGATRQQTGTIRPPLSTQTHNFRPQRQNNWQRPQIPNYVPRSHTGKRF